MLIPPVLLFIRIRRPRGLLLWLPVPLVLLWPALAAAEAIVIPLSLVVGVAALPWGKAKSVLAFTPRAMELFASLRGLKVHVRGGREEVLVAFI